jgi:fatty acid desaturase
MIFLITTNQLVNTLNTTQFTILSIGALVSSVMLFKRKSLKNFVVKNLLFSKRKKSEGTAAAAMVFTLIFLGSLLLIGLLFSWKVALIVLGSLIIISLIMNLIQSIKYKIKEKRESKKYANKKK